MNTKQCPLCGDDNQCGMASGAKVCWCFDATIDLKILEKIPELERNKRCICQKCASSKAES